jgi:hypothetical protein
MFKAQSMTNENVLKKATEEIFDHCINRIFQRITEHPAFNENLAPQLLSQTIIEHYKSILIMKKAQKNVYDSCVSHLNVYHQKLVKNHPIKSQIKGWLDECIAIEKVEIN